MILDSEEARALVLDYVPESASKSVQEEGRFSGGWLFFYSLGTPEENGALPPGRSGLIAVYRDGSLKNVSLPSPEGFSILAEIREGGMTVSKDDMHVVMYKIMAYLYSCMKSGEIPNPDFYRCDGSVLHIPYQYWASIIDQLVDHGYVKGFVVIPMFGGELVIDEDNPRITMEGVEFLNSNSMMKKALSFLKETKSALPFI